MFLDDVQRTPETMRFIWDYQHERQFPEFLRSSHHIWLVGRGASLSACLAASFVFRAFGFPAKAELASTMLHFAIPAVSSEDCVILVSQSGESAETVRLAKALADQHIHRTLAITNYPESSLARSTSAICDLCSARDSLVSVTTYTASFLVLKKVAFYVSQQQKPQVDLVITEAERLLDEGKVVVNRLIEQITIPRVIDILGRGPLLGSAYQANIILREVSTIPTSVWETGEFRHGAIEATQPDQLTLLFAVADGPLALLDNAFGDKLRHIPGATLIVGPSSSELPMSAPIGFRPVLDPIIVHHLALRLAQAQDIIPDAFQWATGVTADEK